MLLDILESIILLSGIAFILSLIIHKTYIVKLNDNMKSSNFVAFIAGSLGVYVVSAIITAIFLPGWLNKIIMLALGLSPFVVGRFATHKYEKYFTAIQILLIIDSISFILFLV